MKQKSYMNSSNILTEGMIDKVLSKLLRLAGKKLTPQEIETLRNPQYRSLMKNYAKFEKKYKDDINSFRKKYNLPKI